MTQDQPPTAPSDPWKSFSGVMAATLMLEAIVVLLAIPVVGAVGGGLTAVSLGYLIGLAVLLILLTGLQRRPWAIWVNLAGPSRRCSPALRCTRAWDSSVCCSPECGP